MSGVRTEEGRFEAPFQRMEEPDQRLREEIRKKREVSDIDDGSVSVLRESVRKKPPLHSFVDAIHRWKHVTHVEAKQHISRVDLVEEQQPTRLEDAHQLGERQALVIHRREMMDDIDGVGEGLRRGG